MPPVPVQCISRNAVESCVKRTALSRACTACTISANTVLPTCPGSSERLRRTTKGVASDRSRVAARTTVHLVRIAGIPRRNPEATEGGCSASCPETEEKSGRGTVRQLARRGGEHQDIAMNHRLRHAPRIQTRLPQFLQNILQREQPQPLRFIHVLFQGQPR